jgi:c-di-GMP-binding flagellar brake protein YcgR
MLLRAADGLDVGAKINFRLELDGELPIEGRARVVRADGDTQRAVVFDEIADAERQRLIHFIFGRQRAALARTRDGGTRRRRTR